MKAKDYARRYKENPNLDVLSEIVSEFCAEAERLIEERHAQYDSAIFAIFDELDEKYRAFVRETGDENLRPDGFSNVIRTEFPFISMGWENHKAFKKFRRNMIRGS
jgi:hypothetical protein